MTPRKKTQTKPAKEQAAAPVPAPLTPAAAQLQVWDHAVRCFAERRFAEAATLFARVEAGPAAHVADKARSYRLVCERKLAAGREEFASAEGHYHYGVERLGLGDIEGARFYLKKALDMGSADEHIFYALACCDARDGDGDGACANLKVAIELEPRNRNLARQDPEFTSLSGRFPDLRALLASRSLE